MRKILKYAATMFVTLLIMVAACMPVMAENKPEEAVVKVVWTYLTDSGVYADLKYGTSFLINDNTVLTNYHNIVFNYVEEKNDAIAYLNENYGLNLSDLASNDHHLHCYILPNRDTRVDCTVDPNVVSDIDHLDLVALHLSTPILDRTPVTLGNSADCKKPDQVFAYGFPSDSLNNKEENTIDDVSVVSGNISKMTVLPYADCIEHSAQLSDGNSGGPLCTSDGCVIGINDYIIDKKNYSIQIDQVKSILDTYGIPYNKIGSNPDPSPSPEPTPPEPLNTKALEDAIEAANLKLSEKLTENSESALRTAISDAENVLRTADSQEAVTRAASELNRAIDGAELKKNVDPMIIALIAAVLIVLLIVIVLLINNNKKKKLEQERRRQAYSGSSGDGSGSIGSGVGNDLTGNALGTSGRMDASAGLGNVSITTVPVSMGTEGTVMLNQGSDGTTFLNSNFESAAYLIRKRSGERIVLSNSNFVIGKEKSKVDYCITDNTAISRTHAIIKKDGDDFVLVDQKSTNCSYVDGAKAYPNQPVKIRDGSVIKLADEEFEFHSA